MKTKTFDCVNMKQQGGQKIRGQLKNMTAHGDLFSGALDGVLP